MNNFAHIFKALSEETRLRIIGLLMDGELCVCDLMEVLELPQSTISRHLAYLRHADLVDGERHGVWMYYRLTSTKTPLLEDVQKILAHQFKDLPTAINDRQTLRDYLAKKGAEGRCK